MKLILTDLKLKTFTEQDALDYCQINDINPDNITVLDLFNNELTDTSNIKYLNSLEYLHIGYNKIKDISVIQYLTKLRLLDIRSLELESD